MCDFELVVLASAKRCMAFCLDLRLLAHQDLIHKCWRNHLVRNQRTILLRDR